MAEKAGIEYQKDLLVLWCIKAELMNKALAVILAPSPASPIASPGKA